MQTAAMTALVEQRSTQTDVFEGIEDCRDCGRVLTRVIFRGRIDVDDAPHRIAVGTHPDDAGRVLVERPLLDGTQGELLDGFPRNG